MFLGSISHFLYKIALIISVEVSNLIITLLSNKKVVVALQNMALKILKSYFLWSNTGFFHLKGQLFFSEVSNPITNLFCFNKVGVPHQKAGI